MLTIAPSAQIVVRELDIGYGSFVVQRDLNFTVEQGKVCLSASSFSREASRPRWPAKEHGRDAHQ
jgi:hypothetical protein